METVRLAVTGFGNVGRGLATLLLQHGEEYEARYGLTILLTGVADRGGAVTRPDWIDPAELLESKARSGSVAGMPGGVAGLHGREFLERAGAMVLVEAASTNFRDAEPGWSYVRQAIEREMDVILASKGSLALHWEEVFAIARESGRHVLYSATVGAPVPSIQIAQSVLPGSQILSFEGILNGTTHQILSAMTRGASYDEGLREAQALGIAETDPTLDVEGFDAAAKVAIVANTVFGSNLGMENVSRQGISRVSAEELRAAGSEGKAVKLIARASPQLGDVTATVAPEAVPLDSPLGRLTGDDMGIVFYTEPLGRMSITVEGGKGGGITTAMTVLRDLFNLARERGWSPPR